MTPPLLEVKNLKKYFPVRRSALGPSSGMTRAVDGISFVLEKGETLGLVGESGCGKSTVGRAILRLTRPDSGEVLFKGKDLSQCPPREMKKLRREMQIIFQDPYASLNPKMRVGRIIEEPFNIHGIGDKKERTERAAELLRQVGLSPDSAQRYPHEFSGGQRQRIGIARAVALNPDFIVADEPVSSLDVSIQAQVINLMQDLQDSRGISYLFISHDMGVVEHFCDRVAVMYLGKFVELAANEALYNAPLHPYTEALLAAIPAWEEGGNRKRVLIKGDVPNPAAPPSGCAFHPRCPIKEKKCEHVVPELKDAGNKRYVACHLRP